MKYWSCKWFEPWSHVIHCKSEKYDQVQIVVLRRTTVYTQPRRWVKTLMMTSTQVVKCQSKSSQVYSPSQEYTHLQDHISVIFCLKFCLKFIAPCINKKFWMNLNYHTQCILLKDWNIPSIESILIFFFLLFPLGMWSGYLLWVSCCHLSQHSCVNS